MPFKTEDIKLCVLDFDGVIANTGVDISEGIRATQRHFGQKMMSRKEIISHVGHGSKRLVEDTLTKLDRDKLPEALTWYNNYYMEHTTVHTKLYPGVRDFLEFLRDKGITACVVTNKPEFLADKILRELGIREFFTLVLGPESVRNMKPDPEGINYCMKYAKASANETVMIGDAYSDIQAGRNAGVHTCGVLYGLGDREKLKAEKPEVYARERLEEMFYR